MTVEKLERVAPFTQFQFGNALRDVPAGVYAAGLFLVLLIAVSLFPGIFAPYDPLAVNLLNALQAPSWAHPFGTDQLGRDVASRVIHGARFSLFIGVTATLVAAVVGALLGFLAGLLPRAVDEAISRIFDTISAFPGLLLALLLIAITGAGVFNLILAIGIDGVPRYGRIVRAEVFRIRNSEYVKQAETFRIPRLQIVLRHVVPNSLGTLPILMTIGLGGAITSAAALSFIGLGPQPPAPEWGAMLAESRNYLRVAWWCGILPGVVLVISIVSVSILGRFLQQRYERKAA